MVLSAILTQKSQKVMKWMRNNENIPIYLTQKPRVRNRAEVMSQQNHWRLNVRFLVEITNDKMPNNEKNMSIVSINMNRDWVSNALSETDTQLGIEWFRRGKLTQNYEKCGQSSRFVSQTNCNHQMINCWNNKSTKKSRNKPQGFQWYVWIIFWLKDINYLKIGSTQCYDWLSPIALNTCWPLYPAIYALNAINCFPSGGWESKKKTPLR